MCCRNDNTEVRTHSWQPLTFASGWALPPMSEEQNQIRFSNPTHLDQAGGLVHWLQQLSDPGAGVARRLRLGRRILVEAKRLGREATLVQLLELVGDHHHLIGLGLHKTKHHI